MKELMGAESSNGIIERHWLHEDGGRKLLTVERIQDVEPILKRNKQEFNSASKSYGRSELQKVASIPAIILERACKIHEIKFPELMACKSDKAKKIWNELLNSRDFTAFRTKPGVVKVNGN